MRKIFFIFFFLLLVAPFYIKAQEVVDPGIDKRTAYVNENLVFSLKSRSEFWGDEVLVIWDFGNGEQAQGKEVAYKYNKAGEYLVLVYVLGEDEVISDNIILVIKEKSERVSYSGGYLNNDIGIIINELLPNPQGSDEENEWIELKNISNKTVDLTGWEISDASGKSAKLTRDKYGSLFINPGDFFLLRRTQTKISLNNNGDTIYLKNKGKVIDSVDYTGSPEGKSWALSSSGKWYWADESTPAQENIDNQFVVATTTDEDMINMKVKDIEKDIAVEEKQIQEKETSIQVLGYAADNVDFEDIKINEIFPNPKGDDRLAEFVELINLGTGEINISGWYLTDGNKSFYFSEGTIIKPGGFLLIERSESKITLNNSGDKVQLFSADDKKIDEVVYTKSFEGKSFARTEEGEFLWTANVTPDEGNDFHKSEDDFSEDYLFLGDISEVADLDKGTKVSFQGVVTVQPGVLGRQFFYMQDSFAGIQIYMFKAEWPDLQFGDIVEISGTVSEAYDEKRINVKTARDIKVVNSGGAVDPLLAESMESAPVGYLLKFSGQIIEKQKDKWLIELDNGDELPVFIKFKNDKLSDFSEGDIINLIGVLRRRNKVKGIYPRSIDDIFLIKQRRDLLLQGQDQDMPLAEEQNRLNIYVLVYLAVISFIIILGGKIYLLKSKQHLNINKQNHG